MPLDPAEDIAKAICSDKWDRNTGEVSPSLFKGKDTSVSGLDVTPIEATWDLFRRNVERPPSRTLELIGEINVGVLQNIGESHTDGRDNPTPVSLTVEADPLPDYESHAIVPQKISRGLANRIVAALKRHPPPAR